MDKIAKLKLAISSRITSVACPPDSPHVGSSFDCLVPVTPDEVHRVLSSLLSKSSPVDFIPTSLIKSCNTVFSELISTLANLSFSQGTFPASIKLVVVSPLLKKQGLDSDNPANHRPISNLHNISNILECLFLFRLQPHVFSFPNFNQFHSAYRQHHFTETALLSTLDNIFRSSDEGKPSTLISLDLSAAFDMIDHRILLSRLHTSFGSTGPAYNFILILTNLYTLWSKLNMGATLVSVSLVYLSMQTTRCYWRLVQMPQETCSKYATNLINDIRLSSMLCSPNVYCVYLLIDHVVCLMPPLLSSILEALS